MTKSNTPKFAESGKIKKNRAEVRTRTSMLGIDMSHSGANAERESTAIYAHDPFYNVGTMMQQIGICEEYARSAALANPILFADWHRTFPELKQLLELAKHGLIGAVIFADVQIFKFCAPTRISTFLTILRDAGVGIHFADDTPTNKLLKLQFSPSGLGDPSGSSRTAPEWSARR